MVEKTERDAKGQGIQGKKKKKKTDETHFLARQGSPYEGTGAERQSPGVTAGSGLCPQDHIRFWEWEIGGQKE